jgi:hypothetical protein
VVVSLVKFACISSEYFAHPANGRKQDIAKRIAGVRKKRRKDIFSID